LLRCYINYCSQSPVWIMILKCQAANSANNKYDSSKVSWNYRTDTEVIPIHLHWSELTTLLVSPKMLNLPTSG
jgi:hypothetical protein